jgi:8-amino-3,8-dideoxy-alpha-D-manno-octulosonate transaminase
MPGFELVGEEERAAVNEVFDEGGVLFRHGFDAFRKKGRFRVIEFEKAFARHMEAEYALAVSSGTAALKVGLMALGIQPGDEVITQAFTFVATVEAILDVGAVPVVVNVDDTLNMDPEEVRRHITPKTRAILPVHMLGVSPEMDQILAIARERGLLVLEDNCESPGATYGGRPLGTLGDVGAFSFDFGKMLTTGEGGMVVANNPEYYKLAREYHDHGHENNPKFPRGRDTHRIYGFNYRMGELQGAIGLAQLQKLEYIVGQNRRHYARLQEGLQKVEGLRFRRIPDKCGSLCDALIFQVPTGEAAGRFAERMAAAGIGTKNLPDAMEWHFAGYWDHIFTRFGMTKEALWESLRPTYERLSRSIALPVMVKYTPERVDQIVEDVTRIAGDLL